MKTFIVPTDFSPIAYNTALYALELAKELKIEKIVFYNAYQQSIALDPMVSDFTVYDVRELQDVSRQGLEHFISQLQKDDQISIQLIAESEYNILADGIIDCAKKYEAELILMGIAHGGKLEEVLIGSDAVTVAGESEVPVLIIPEDARYRKIKKILFTCDMEKVAETTPVEAIKKILLETKAEMHVLHVGTGKQLKEELVPETLILDNLFREFSPQYHFSNLPDFTEAINTTVENYNMDLIIVIPKKHGLFEGIFKKSHTKALAFHSHVPLLSIHE